MRRVFNSLQPFFTFEIPDQFCKVDSQSDMSGMNGFGRRLPGHGLRVASFFSGAGGLDLGFHQAGFDIVFASDVEKVFCSTLHANVGRYVSEHVTIRCADIRDLRASHVPVKVDLVIGGPPCQTFSASGRRAGGAAGRLDPRGTLFEAYCRILEKLRPAGFLFENVRGILGTNRGRDWRQIVSTFSDLGYRLSYRILDACDYGIPQHRERLLLVGHKMDCDFMFPEPTYGCDATCGTKHISPREALSDVEHQENLTDLKLQGGKYAHLLQLVPPGGNYLFFTARRGYAKPIFAYRSRFSDFLYKANPDYPIKTLIASPGKYTGPFHWENRCFSIGEYKRLQGFPDDYRFCGTRSEIIRQIGNSVSPKIAYHLALAIAKQLFGRDREIVLMPPNRQLSFDRRKGAEAQRTRQRHREVSLRRKNGGSRIFDIHEYATRVEPCEVEGSNVAVECEGKHVRIAIRGDDSGKRYATVRINIAEHEPNLFTTGRNEADAELFIDLFGEQAHCVQTMWNAVDDWVIRSSNFHSLYELYGHFTEPHPILSIDEFQIFSKHPIAKFAVHAAKFENCSRYFRRNHLTDMFGGTFGTSNFPQLAKILRQFRFDIRCHETNIAIPTHLYMVAYPFTLPSRKQMNFSVKTRSSAAVGADAQSG